MNWIIACLHAAALFAFTGAVLDLIQLLIRGKHSAAAVQNTNPFLALTITREVTYSLSFGLRYVFYWGFVGSPPVVSDGRDTRDLHSGSWARWGITGFFLQWALVVSALAITALQVLFRVYTPLQRLGAIQDAEGALEACVSAILILKLLLNIYLAALDSYGAIRRLHLFLRYLPMILALAISAAIGAGNIIELLFSETILARFLQGTELYILVLYMLVDAFRSRSTKFNKRRIDRSSSFHNMPPVIPRSSEFLLGPPKVPEPKFNPMFGEELSFAEPSKPPQSWEPSLAGYSLRVSNWFGRRPSKSTTTQPTRNSAWGQDQAERGMSPVVEGMETALLEKTAAPESMGPLQSPVVKEPVYTAIVISDPVDPVDVVSPQAAAVAFPPRAYSRDFDKQYLYPMTPNSMSDADSPVHGLYGVVNAKRPPSTGSLSLDEDPRDVFARSARSSGISGLLREQEELDKSIAALKLLARPEDESKRASSTGSMSPGQFSLSVFPEPPWGRASIGSVAFSAGRPLVTTSGQRAETAFPEHARQQSFPLSELAVGDSDLLPPSRRNIMTASGGTQYEITSFIGNLTHPEHLLQNSISTEASFAVGSAGSATKTEKMLITIPESSPAASEAGSSKASPSSLTSSRTLTVGGKVRQIGLPSGPRLHTSTVPPSVRSTITSSYMPTPF
ncbi:uncharacterized protein PHACADRAFT_247213 [Phanerochaete carnosa HHB-10118-sp]|uniref:Uncharacterized protein n=1 Tax=Phanerochaete carnosa (strain HHB-10118-sp) TaxID=650164 RepID=K5WNF0_PHACS|nr:uncharacterized protein PHACADRAFT_247213 [Phanerochaete carnosa HHB-10118-sp]EKM60965.1 hypothetical protein PHACADRAFT_247213 [Phanerochaete carnosa HHB-10118-sp]